LQQLSDLVVPDLTDWCTIAMRSDGGAIETIALAHADPEKVEWAKQMGRRYPIRPDGRYGVANVLRTGFAEIHPDVPEELVKGMAQDEEHLEVLRKIGLRSAIVVPLPIRGRAVGAMTLVRSTAERSYDADDLALAEELARRAAMAIENAQSYERA